MQPSHQPTSFPSYQQTRIPTVVATEHTIAGEWVSVVADKSKLTSELVLVNDNIWAGVAHGSVNVGAYCSILNAVSGMQLIKYAFPWADVTTIAQARDEFSVTISGVIIRSDFISAELASCAVGAAQLTCTTLSFINTKLAAASYAAAAKSMVYIGKYNDQALMMIVDSSVVTATTRSFLYSTTIVKDITFTHIQSPPNYIGSFVSGTCDNGASIHYIFTGVVRADTGALTATYVRPASGSILNSAELVNTMAQEFVNPDSYIAGGMQLTNEVSMQAYLICVNSIYRRVVFGVRYVLPSVRYEHRRYLLGKSAMDSSVNDMVLVNGYLYLVIGYQDSPPQRSISVIKTDLAAGNILQQVQIYSSYASIQCTDIAISGQFLAMACSVKYTDNITQSSVLSVNRELTFSQLPDGFRRYENDTFIKESLAFKSTFLPMTGKSLVTSPLRYSFNTADGQPTLRPSEAPTPKPSTQPLRAPSGQPSSNPTSAPSVSPQPTSHPSSSGPTNTYKPTVKSTHQPSRAPSKEPTVSPTTKPTLLPTSLPSAKPSPIPSTLPSLAGTLAPSHTPTVKPTRKPSPVPSIKLTETPTSAASTSVEVVEATIGSTSQSADEAVMIFLYVLVGVTGAWCAYQLLKCCAQTQRVAKKKRILRAEQERIFLSMRSHQHRNQEQKQAGANVNSFSVAATTRIVTHKKRGTYAGRPMAPDIVCSDSSSSIVISSLHSSEISSELSCSVHSSEQYSGVNTSYTETAKRSESIMEEEEGSQGYLGSGYGYGASGSNSGSDIICDHSASSDGQSDNYVSEGTFDYASAEGSTASDRTVATDDDDGEGEGDHVSDEHHNSGRSTEDAASVVGRTVKTKVTDDTENACCSVYDGSGGDNRGDDTNDSVL